MALENVQLNSNAGETERNFKSVRANQVMPNIFLDQAMAVFLHSASILDCTEILEDKQPIRKESQSCSLNPESKTCR